VQQSNTYKFHQLAAQYFIHIINYAYRYSVFFMIQPRSTETTDCTIHFKQNKAHQHRKFGYTGLHINALDTSYLLRSNKIEF